MSRLQNIKIVLLEIYLDCNFFLVQKLYSNSFKCKEATWNAMKYKEGYYCDLSKNISYCGHGHASDKLQRNKDFSLF